MWGIAAPENVPVSFSARAIVHACTTRRTVRPKKGKAYTSPVYTVDLDIPRDRLEFKGEPPECRALDAWLRKALRELRQRLAKEGVYDWQGEIREGEYVLKARVGGGYAYLGAWKEP